jgi:hypothetical protein
MEDFFKNFSSLFKIAYIRGKKLTGRLSWKRNVGEECHQN